MVSLLFLLLAGLFSGLSIYMSVRMDRAIRKQLEALRRAQEALVGTLGERKGRG